MMLTEAFVGAFARAVASHGLGIEVSAIHSVENIAEEVLKTYGQRLTERELEARAASKSFDELGQRGARSAKERGGKSVEAEDVERGTKACGLIFICVPPQE